MKIFDTIIHEIKGYVEKKKNLIQYQTYKGKKTVSWPKTDKHDIVLLPDLSVELGNPDVASVSFLTWTESKSLIKDNEITLIGPDIKKSPGKNLPFGKVVMLEVEGFDEKNAFDRNREMYLSKFDLSLKGFMLKSASHYMAEWCRISKEALKNNFSFEILGSAIINEYKKLDYVKSVELIFVTASNDDVNELYNMGNRSVRIINAMSKMINEMSYDCTECEYQDICDDADELRALRNSLKR